MKSKIRIAGVVILYNPDHKVISNISSYIEKLEVLYVIDNSEVINDDFVSIILKHKKVIYIALGENFGIAKALNVGLEKALDEGFEWAFTMDQDSSTISDMIDKMITYINNHSTSMLAIVSPYHQINIKEIPKPEKEVDEPKDVMASGNLLNLSIYKKSGGFLEKLFIDHVDVEYCYRLRANNYQIVRLNSAELNHKLGEHYTIVNLAFGKKIITTNHNYIRKYYIVRNGLYVKKLYKDLIPLIYKDRYIYLLKQIVIVILAEKNKMKKIKFMIRGFLDYKKGKFGKLII